MAKLVSSFDLAPETTGGGGLLEVQFVPLPHEVRFLPGYDEALLLAGHLTASEFQAFRDRHNPGIAASRRKELNRQYEAAREAQSALDPVATENAWIRPFEDPRAEELARTPAFIDAFGPAKPEFGWVVPHLIVPSQAYVKLNGHSDSAASVDLFEVSFPEPAQPQFEIVSNGEGGIFMVSSSPHIHSGGQPLVRSTLGGLVTVTVGLHSNFVLIASYGDVYFGRNGTHRLEWATRVGIGELPALVLRSNSAREAGVALGIDGFDIRAVSQRRRPPLVGDFRTTAAIQVPMRRENYGWEVRTRGLRAR